MKRAVHTGAPWLAALLSLLTLSDGWADTCTVPGTYRTVQAAIDAPRCSEIQVAGGVYRENLVIDRDVYIHGAGADATTLNGTFSGSVIVVDRNRQVTLSNLGIVNGQAQQGGGILNRGILELNHCLVADNRAKGGDGAVGTNGYRELTGALRFVPAEAGGPGWAGFGGGIYNAGQLTLNHCQVRDNRAEGGNGGNGGAGYDGGQLDPAGIGRPARGSAGRDADCSKSPCTTATNGGLGGAGADGGSGGDGGAAGKALGGGIQNDSSGSLTLNFSTVTGNVAKAGIGGNGGPGGPGQRGGEGGHGGDADSGGLTRCSSAGTGGRGGSGGSGGQGGTGGDGLPAQGGGIYNDYGTVTVANSTIENNTVIEGQWGNRGEAGTGGDPGDGGGGGSPTTLKILGITICSRPWGNSGPDGYSGRDGDPGAAGRPFGSRGAGLYNGAEGEMAIARSSIAANVANGTSEAIGGGVSNAGNLSVVNSTLSGNNATALSTLAVGGGLYNGGQTDLFNATLYGNDVNGQGGGLFNSYDLSLGNSIIADNKGGGDCGGDAVTSLGHNLDSDRSCRLGGTNDQSGQTARLGPLQANGAAVKSHAPLSGSPALDAGSNAICAAAPVSGTDQRGVGRPQLGAGASPSAAPRCDIGAVEAVAPEFGEATGLSGAWWEPASSGQGVNLWQRGDLVFGAWYLYDGTGRDLWVTFSGYIANGRLSSTLRGNAGPALGDGPWDVSRVSEAGLGTVTLVFNSERSITFDYTLNGVSGRLELEPFEPLGAALEDGPYAGVWWEPAKSGQGLNLWNQDGRVFGAWFLYDGHGQAMWVTFGAPLNGSGITQVPLVRQSGPALGAPWDTALLAPTEVGTADLRFGDDGTAAFDYTIDGVSGSLELIRFYP